MMRLWTYIAGSTIEWQQWTDCIVYCCMCGSYLAYCRDGDDCILWFMAHVVHFECWNQLFLLFNSFVLALLDCAIDAEHIGTSCDSPFRTRLLRIVMRAPPAPHARAIHFGHERLLGRDDSFHGPEAVSPSGLLSQVHLPFSVPCERQRATGYQIQH